MAKGRRIDIPPQVEWIIGELNRHGYEAYAVGGCVRDTLLGRTPGDWDITTSARPMQVKRVFGRTIDTGLQHGTVTVLRDHVGYEITTYRIDGEYEDGRHPKEVAFTADLREDLRRRDFTINAMAYSHETGIVDIFGGVEDLNRRLIRCVGDARERFTEDALRILRAIRFSAQLGFSIEEDTWKALSEIAPNLAHVSKERIQAELTKTLLSAHPERIRMVEETGMSPYISATFRRVFEEQEAFWNRRDIADSVSSALNRLANLPSEKAVRWGAFLLPVGEKDAVRILRELKLDNDTIRHVKTLVHWFTESLPGDETALRRLMSAMEDRELDWLLEMWKVLGMKTQQPICPLPYQEEQQRREPIREQAESLYLLTQQIRRRGDCIRLKNMAVKGADLIQAGVSPGPALGETLNRLFAYVLEHPEENIREKLMERIEDNKDITWK